MQALPHSDDSERMERLRRRINVALCAVILGGAAGTFVWLILTRPDPGQQARPQQVREVEVATVELCTFDAPVVGHGNVRATSPLKIVPEVGGALVHVHKDLAVGKRIAKGEVLFEIDARSYQAEADAAQSEIKRLEASLAQLRQEELALRERVENARELLALAERNRNREDGLAAENVSTPLERELAQISYLKQKELVLQYENQLAQSPHRISEIEALLEMQRTKLAEAQRRVEKTKIYCPFDARVESVSAAELQVVVVGFAIASLTNLEAMELAVGVDPGDLRWTPAWDYLHDSGTDRSAPPPHATISWTVDDREYRWKGTVARLERLDEVTRTARVVIEITDATDEVTLDGGEIRPALSLGMFCRVEIPATPLENAIVVPRSAVQDAEDGSATKFVWVFQPSDPSSPGEGVLTRRVVPALRTVDNRVLVSYAQADSGIAAATTDLPACELQPGEQIVLSQLPWATEGMRLRRQGANDPASPAALSAGSGNQSALLASGGGFAGIR